MSKGVLGKIESKDVNDLLDCFYDMEEEYVKVDGQEVKVDIQPVENPKEFYGHIKLRKDETREDVTPVATVKMPNVLRRSRGIYYDYGIIYYHKKDGTYRVHYDFYGDEQAAQKVIDELEGEINKRLPVKQVQSNPLTQGATTTTTEDGKIEMEKEVDVDELVNNFGSFSPETQEKIRPILNGLGIKV